MRYPMNKKPTPFGVMILIRATQEALAQPDAIKSKILGNALFVSQDTFFPAQVDLSKSENYRNLADAQKKLVAAELDKSKFPNYDLFKSIPDFVMSTWTEKTKFEKKDKPMSRPVVAKKKVSSKKAKVVSSPAAPTVVYKTKKLG